MRDVIDMPAERLQHQPELEGKKFDLVICGGGPAGVYLSEVLQKKVGSDYRILLLEQRDTIGGTADASLQQYREVPHGAPALVERVTRSVSFFDSLRQELDLPESEAFRKPFPYLWLAGSERQLERYKGYVELNQQWGYKNGTHILKPEEIRKMYPFVDGDISGGLLVNNSGQIYANRVFDEITKRATKTTFATGVEMQQIQVEHDKVASITTNKGTVKADKVILCPGPFIVKAEEYLSGGTLFENGKLEQVVAATPRKVFSSEVKSVTPNTHVMLVSPSGAYVRLLTGPDGNGEGIYGFSFPKEKRIKDPVLNLSAHDEFFSSLVYRLLERAVSRYGNHDGLQVKPNAYWGGYYVQTPDDLPIIDSTNIDGLYVFTALTHVGVMTGYGFAHDAADMVLQQAQKQKNPFSINRNFSEYIGIVL